MCFDINLCEVFVFYHHIPSISVVIILSPLTHLYVHIMYLIFFLFITTNYDYYLYLYYH